MLTINTINCHCSVNGIKALSLICIKHIYIYIHIYLCVCVCVCLCVCVSVCVCADHGGPSGVRRISAVTLFLLSGVRIPMKSGKFYSCVCCVDSGLCRRLITPTEESYRMCVIYKQKKKRRSGSELGCCATKMYINLFYNIYVNSRKNQVKYIRQSQLYLVNDVLHCYTFRVHRKCHQAIDIECSNRISSWCTNSRNM